MAKATPKKEAEDFPVLKISTLGFAERLKKILPFIGREETRRYLMGVLFTYKSKEGILRLTATNGHIICEMTLCSEDLFTVEKKGMDFSVIVPLHAIEHFISLVNYEEDIFIRLRGVTDTVIEFNFTDFCYTTKVINGCFPDTSKVIPTGTLELGANINATYLLNVLDALKGQRIHLFADKNDGLNPYLFSSSKAEGIKCVVMPMRNEP